MQVHDKVEQFFDLCERALVPMVAVCAHLLAFVLLALFISPARPPGQARTGDTTLEISVLVDVPELPASREALRADDQRPASLPNPTPAAEADVREKASETPPPPSEGDAPRRRDASVTVSRPPTPTPTPAPNTRPDKNRRGEAKTSGTVTDLPGEEVLHHRAAFFGKRKQSALTAGERDAVDAALRWLTVHQSASGAFASRGFLDNCPPGDPCGSPGMKGNDAALTGLALLAFLGAGEDQDSPRFGDTVRRAAQWLVMQQDESGAYHQRMYTHAIAMLAVAESFAVSGDTAQRASLRSAVRHAALTQGRLGGWTYTATPRAPRNDTSITAWMTMALVSAAHAGVDVPPETLHRVVYHFRRMTEPDGRVSYADADPDASRVSAAMTAIGVYCRVILGQSPTEDVNRRAMARVLSVAPRWDESRSLDRSLYALFASTLAARVAGERAWTRWRTTAAGALIAHQRREKHARGSWDPVGMWGPHGGRVYSTALCALILECTARRAAGAAPPPRLELSDAWTNADLGATLGIARPTPANERARLAALRAAERDRLNHYLRMWRALRAEHSAAARDAAPESLEVVATAIESARKRIRELDAKIAALD